MRIGKIALVAIALLLAGATAFMAKSWIDAERSAIRKASAPKQTGGQRVLVAKTRLGTGQFINQENVHWVVWPESSMSPAYFVQGKHKLEDIVGSVVRNPVGVGEPLNTARVVSPNGRGFMAAVLQPGMRAVSVPVTLTTGISGFIFPGDRVDIILTHTYQQGQDGARDRKAGETVLTDVRVLALDQRTDSKPGETHIARTVTFEVTPKQSETLAVALDLGKLSLTLRSLARDEAAEAAETAAASGSKVSRTSFTLDSEASSLLAGSGNARTKVRVLRGTGDEK
ncbi:MAG: Flp pilus assembly protein CpaB [Reyranellaceae bacterium]